MRFSFVVIFGRSLIIGVGIYLIGCDSSPSGPSGIPIYEVVATPLISSYIPTGRGYGASVDLNDTFAAVGSSDCIVSGVGEVAIFRREGSSWIEENVETHPDQTNTSACWISVWNDYLAVSSHTEAENGVAYIYRRSDSIWRFHQLITPPSHLPVHAFGWSVEMDGGFLFIGSLAKFARIYWLAGDQWVLDTHLEERAATSRRFGQAASLNGNDLAVFADNMSELEDAVYVYQREGLEWAEQFSAMRPTSYPHDRSFGESLAIDDDLLVVGIASLDETFPGGAQIYERGADGSWTRGARLYLPGSDTTGLSYDFGATVEVSNGRVAIAAPRLGTVFLFEQYEGDWIEVLRIEKESISESRYFGESLVLSGDHLLVGDAGSGKATLYTIRRTN